MNSFLKHLLPAFAKSNPGVEIHISPRPAAHPVIRGHYINGKEKAVCVRNLEMEQVLQKAELLRDASGEVNQRTRGKITSTNESVRGVWSPFHAAAEKAWKI
jgi:large subunit ribosomal protein L43